MASALVYLDDVDIFWWSSESHQDHLMTLLGLLSGASVSLKQKKYLFENLIDYLGNII